MAGWEEPGPKPWQDSENLSAGRSGPTEPGQIPSGSRRRNCGHTGGHRLQVCPLPESSALLPQGWDHPAWPSGARQGTLAQPGCTPPSHPLPPPPEADPEAGHLGAGSRWEPVGRAEREPPPRRTAASAASAVSLSSARFLRGPRPPVSPCPPSPILPPPPWSSCCARSCAPRPCAPSGAPGPAASARGAPMTQMPARCLSRSTTGRWCVPLTHPIPPHSSPAA